MINRTKFWLIFWFALSVVSVISAYSLNQFLWKGAFYHLTAISFVSIFRHLYIKSKGNWSLAYFVVWLVALNNLADELFFDATELDWNEWTAFFLIILISYIQRKKWTR